MSVLTKRFLWCVIALQVVVLSGCAVTHPNRTPLGEVFPSVSGESLAKERVQLPQDFPQEPVLLLLGYVQQSQFDIDRWLIGLDMTQTQVTAFELPTLQGLAPQVFKPFINEGMRNGIPKEIWGGVVTIYQDGDQIQALTGNENPNNARVLLLNAQREIVYFYDRGFAVAALNELRETLAALQ